MSDKEKQPEKERDWHLLEFYMPISENLTNDKDEFIIRGVAINETTTLNNVKYVAEELSKAAASFRNVPILLDHVNEVKNIVGRTTENVDFNAQLKRIDFEGKIMDKDIREMIKDGRVGSVSIGAKVQDLKEEEDGSMKAIGIHGLEISLVAVPGDNQANLAQAIQNSFYLKEKANMSEQLNKSEEKIMAEEEQKTEVEAPEEKEEEKSEESTETEEPAKEEPAKEESKDEEKEEPATEKSQNIHINVGNDSDVAEMKKQIAEITELLKSKKDLKSTMKKEETTKGKISTEKTEALDKLDSLIVEKAGSKFAMYRDYSMEDASTTKLKRLIR